MATHNSQSLQSHGSHKIPLKHGVVGVALLALFIVGGVGVSAFAGQAASDFEANSLSNTQSVARRRVLTYLDKNKEKPAAEKVSCDGISKDPATYKGEFLARSISFDAQPEQKYKVSLYLKNTGTTPWIGDASNCTGAPLMRLGTARPHDHASAVYSKDNSGWKSSSRIAMKESRIEPGEIATFSFVMSAPKAQDIYKEFFQPAIETVGWMEDAASTMSMDIRVGDYDDSAVYRSLLLGYSGRASQLDPNGQLAVDVNLTTQLVKVTYNGTLVREYLSSTGKSTTPTPPGRFKILQKQELRIGSASPHYRMPHFQLLTPGGVGFHSLPYLENDKGLFWTEALNHIGRRVSHGCVRLLPEDSKELFNLTAIGTPVVIHY